MSSRIVPSTTIDRHRNPPQKVFGPSKPTPNTFSEGIWSPIRVTKEVKVVWFPMSKKSEGDSFSVY